MIEKINNNWLFINNFEESYLKSRPTNLVTVSLPHTVKETPYSYFSEYDYQFVSTYFRDIEIKEDIKDNNYFLKFDGVMVKCKIYFNGEFLGDFISTYLPFQVDVTKFIKKGKNELVIVVDSKEDKLIPPFGFVVDYLTYGGIYRDVFLIKKPKVYIKDIFVHGFMDGTIKIQKTLSETASNSTKCKYELYFKDELVKSFTDDTLKIDNVHLWDIDDPNLYILKAVLEDGDSKDEVIVRFGFRDAIFKTDGFYLNNKKIKIIGLNRHQAYPYVGYAMPKGAQEDDALILKNEIGVNAVRCSHYPPSDHFLAKCDEIGLLVFDEVPGWQHIGQEKEWRENFWDFIKRMALKDRNFTSIIAYGVRIDESPDDHELYSKANEIIHELDPYKQTTGVRNFKNSECLEDFYSYNDFSCGDEIHGFDDPKTIHKDGKPYIVTECMGHTKPTKNYDHEAYRVSTALRYARIVDDCYKYQNMCGFFGWCAFDYNTHKDFGSGDHICHHGVYDMYRNPKISSAIFKAQNTKEPYLEVLGNQNIGDYCAAIFDYIYVATNLDYVDFYINEKYISRFYPDKKDFPNTPHPLIKIDDLIGDRIEEEFSKKDLKLLKDGFNYVAFHGYGKLPLKYALIMARVLVHTRKPISYFMNLYTKYVQNWGSESTGYIFKGYKDGKEVIIKRVGPSMGFELSYDVKNNPIKIDESYDVTRVSIKHLDQNGSLMNYSFIPLELSTNNNIEVIGPKVVSLQGGQISVYVKGLKKGKGKLTIKSQFGTKDLEIDVK